MKSSTQILLNIILGLRMIKSNDDPIMPSRVNGITLHILLKFNE